MAKKRAGQQYIPGTEPPSIPEIDPVADRYVKARDAFLRFKDQMEDEHTDLKALMEKHGLTKYEYDGKEVVMEDRKRVKVRRKKEGKDAS
jgi:hypothetical protein